MKKKLLLLPIMLLSFVSAFGQGYFGLSQFNYSGVIQGNSNVGFLADNRYKVDVVLGGFSLAGYNNHMFMNTMNMPSGWYSSFKDTTWTGHPNFGKIVVDQDSVDYYRANGANFFTIDDDNVARKVSLNNDIDLFNTLISISETRSIGFGIRQRNFVNIDHIAPEVISLSVNELEVPSLHDLDLSDQLLNLSFNSWMEFHGSYAQVFYNQGEHFIKAGGRIKLLKGLGSAYVYTDNVDYNFDNSDTAAYITGDFNYGYSNNLGSLVEALDNEVSFEDLAAQWQDNPVKAIGTLMQTGSRLGVGVDIGGVYEYRPNFEDYKYDMDGETDLWKRDENKYLFRAALSFNDIGGMRYDKGELSRDFAMRANVLDMAVFDNIAGPRSFDSTIVALADSGQLTFSPDNPSFYRMTLPTNMVIDLDYMVFKDLYVNFNSLINLTSKRNENKVHYNSYLSISPRYDNKWVGAAVPISWSQFMGLRVGTSLRFGPFFVGTGDLKPFFAPTKDKNLMGAEIYGGVRIPILYKTPKDRDGDKVSDKVEKKHRKEIREKSGDKKTEGCIDVPGVWEFKGCPDTDGDHIQDSEDSCIYDAGIPEFNGCPDTDGDKIIDKLDDCPEEAGLEEFNGCPDTDGDGIMDKEDDCPEEAGLAEFNGCPDKDGDGIMDKEDDCPNDAGTKEFNGCPDRDGDKIIDIDDLCPDDAGPLENQGCPDTDKDGIFDFLDNCPEKAGPKENGGCPWPDTDEDGILDKDDECPLNPGPKANKGCPYTDTDGDGVKDKDDECVNTPGPVDNNGCPVIEEVDLAIINAAFENLEFETGKSVIKESSHESLDSLASLLVRKPDWLLEIVGHTDNVGAAQNNLILSKQRAQAVATYLNQRGVPEEHMIVMFFGEEKPIADNNTKEGRQKNRRVEMTIVFK